MKHNTLSQKTNTINKQLVMAFFVAMMLIGTAFTKANAATTTTVNSNAVALFKEAYKNVSKVTWKTTKLFSKASFVQDGVAMEVFYNNNDGSLIATSKSISFTTLPAAAIKYISKNYAAPNYTLKSCIEYTNSDNETSYYVSVEGTKATKVLEVSNNGSVSVFKTIK
ncbi:hypothetical protein [Parasediminibacterium sp. JCM 36343]|uniref:hypothetical protein n=1 Tax=Parasediminibacterium sp. JCM 36343 TaxID=3374279 RepID=UPI003978A409